MFSPRGFLVVMYTGMVYVLSLEAFLLLSLSYIGFLDDGDGVCPLL